MKILIVSLFLISLGRISFQAVVPGETADFCDAVIKKVLADTPAWTAGTNTYKQDPAQTQTLQFKKSFNAGDLPYSGAWTSCVGFANTLGAGHLLSSSSVTTTGSDATTAVININFATSTIVQTNGPLNCYSKTPASITFTNCILLISLKNTIDTNRKYGNLKITLSGTVLADDSASVPPTVTLPTYFETMTADFCDTALKNAFKSTATWTQIFGAADTTNLITSTQKNIYFFQALGTPMSQEWSFTACIATTQISPFGNNYGSAILPIWTGDKSKVGILITYGDTNSFDANADQDCMYNDGAGTYTYTNCYMGWIIKNAIDTSRTYGGIQMKISGQQVLATPTYATHALSQLDATETGCNTHLSAIFKSTSAWAHGNHKWDGNGGATLYFSQSSLTLTSPLLSYVCVGTQGGHNTPYAASGLSNQNSILAFTFGLVYPKSTTDVAFYFTFTWGNIGSTQKDADEVNKNFAFRQYGPSVSIMILNELDPYVNNENAKIYGVMKLTLTGSYINGGQLGSTYPTITLGMDAQPYAKKSKTDCDIILKTVFASANTWAAGIKYFSRQKAYIQFTSAVALAHEWNLIDCFTGDLRIGSRKTRLSLVQPSVFASGSTTALQSIFFNLDWSLLYLFNWRPGERTEFCYQYDTSTAKGKFTNCLFYFYIKNGQDAAITQYDDYGRLVFTINGEYADFSATPPATITATWSKIEDWQTCETALTTMFSATATWTATARQSGNNLFTFIVSQATGSALAFDCFNFAYLKGNASQTLNDVYANSLINSSVTNFTFLNIPPPSLMDSNDGTQCYNYTDKTFNYCYMRILVMNSKDVNDTNGQLGWRGYLKLVITGTAASPTITPTWVPLKTEAECKTLVNDTIFDVTAIKADVDTTTDPNAIQYNITLNKTFPNFLECIYPTVGYFSYQINYQALSPTITIGDYGVRFVFWESKSNPSFTQNCYSNDKRLYSCPLFIELRSRYNKSNGFGKIKVKFSSQAPPIISATMESIDARSESGFLMQISMIAMSLLGLLLLLG